MAEKKDRRKVVGTTLAIAGTALSVSSKTITKQADIVSKAAGNASRDFWIKEGRAERIQRVHGRKGKRFKPNAAARAKGAAPLLRARSLRFLRVSSAAKKVAGSRKFFLGAGFALTTGGLAFAASKSKKESPNPGAALGAAAALASAKFIKGSALTFKGKLRKGEKPVKGKDGGFVVFRNIRGRVVPLKFKPKKG